MTGSKLWIPCFIDIGRRNFYDGVRPGNTSEHLVWFARIHACTTRDTNTSIKCPVAGFGKISIVSSEWLKKSVIRRHCMLTGENECIQFVGCCSRTIYQEFFLHLWGWFQLVWPLKQGCGWVLDMVKAISRLGV